MECDSNGGAIIRDGGEPDQLARRSRAGAQRRNICALGEWGLIVTSSGLAISHRDTIVMQAAKHRIPAVYYSRAFVAAGGLISYGSDRVAQFRSVAGYVDRKSVV